MGFTEVGVMVRPGVVGGAAGAGIVGGKGYDNISSRK